MTNYSNSLTQMNQVKDLLEEYPFQFYASVGTKVMIVDIPDLSLGVHCSSLLMRHGWVCSAYPARLTKKAQLLVIFKPEQRDMSY